MKVKEYCVYLKMNGRSSAPIQILRSQFDPLALSLPPHVTLVFPFGCSWNLKKLEDAISIGIKAARRFPFTLAGPKVLQSYAYFPLSIGGRHASKLNEALYSTELKDFRSPEFEHVLHVIFGRYSTEAESDKVVATIRDFPVELCGQCGEVVLGSIGPEGIGRVDRAWALPT